MNRNENAVLSLRKISVSGKVRLEALSFPPLGKRNTEWWLLDSFPFLRSLSHHLTLGFVFSRMWGLWPDLILGT